MNEDGKKAAIDELVKLGGYPPMRYDRIEAWGLLMHAPKRAIEIDPSCEVRVEELLKVILAGEFITRSEPGRSEPGNAEEWLRVERIARVCHEANRGLQRSWPTEGIGIQVEWDEFVDEDGEQADGVRKGVRRALEGATPEELHKAWCNDKYLDGWVLGAVKDHERKTHPCLVAYKDLPVEQRCKDELFVAIVGALA